MDRRHLLAGIGALSALAASPALAQARQRLRFAVTDVDGAENLQREFGPFKAAFEKVMPSVEIALFPVSGRTAAVEAMNANQVDLVLTGPAEYVVFKARMPHVQPVVVWQRPDYFSQIVVLAEGPIKTMAELKGKKVSFGEIGSTSQHLGPAQILADAGLAYGRDYEALFLRRNVAVEALRRGDLAGIGMNLTHIQQIRRAVPDVKLAVVGRGRDLPDDLIIAAPSVSADAVTQIRKAFIDHAAPLLQAILQVEGNARWAGGTFLPNVQDRDYDGIRQMYRSVGVNEFTRFIGQ
ncbi:MAG: PhnD/SsuA/transferrin family substrate-binding protein [Beijerinckiaceae bacterium]